MHIAKLNTKALLCHSALLDEIAGLVTLMTRPTLSPG
jgi:hypothetical protein